MLQYFNYKLYEGNYYFNSFEDDITEENCGEDLDKKDIIYKDIMKDIETLLDDKNDLEPAESLVIRKKNYNNIRNNKRNNNKKAKIKKMKNYNIKKGDWQCKHCFNINFHFRFKCNICDESR